MTVQIDQLKYCTLLFATMLVFSGCKSRHEEPKTEPVAEKKPVDKTPKKRVEAAATKKNRPERPKQSSADPKAYENATISYSVKLETTQGEVVVDVYEKLAPLAAERFKILVEEGFYNDAVFFRVIKGFVAQAGIAGDPEVNAKWRTKRMKDDPVIQSNIKGTITFASAGPNSRTTQFFINYKDNANLDGMGFAPFGKVREMEPVEKFYGEYSRGRGPSQPLIQKEGNAYLKKEFPKLDYIKKATILKK
jgi:peptidyl-prolyl cis-trans isomerase A (cyclophilin A)